MRAVLYMLFVCLQMTAKGWGAGKLFCSLSDITAQQSMTGGKATSSTETWVILSTLFAPLFIPSAPRVWLLFHRWRRHAAVITLLLSLSFFGLLCGWTTGWAYESIFPFWIPWFMGLAVVFSLGTLGFQALCTLSDNHSTSVIQLYVLYKHAHM